MIAYLGLGSNLGDRLANLQQALNRLDMRAGEVQRVSRVFESAPMYVENQPSFLNAVVKLRTNLQPEELLRVVKQIEVDCGRLARERYGPREVDIDLLALTGDGGDVLEYKNDKLALPHPMLCERRFVLEPLYEIEPDLDVCGGLCSRLESGPIQAQKCEPKQDAVLSVHSD